MILRSGVKYLYIYRGAYKGIAMVDDNRSLDNVYHARAGWDYAETFVFLQPTDLAKLLYGVKDS